jgi:hypothetical protein
MAESLEDQPDKLPRSIDAEGKLIVSNSGWWCSGFFPGSLWYLYENNNDPALLAYARNYTVRIEKEQYFTDAKRLKLPHNCAFVPIIECNAQGGEVLDLCTDRYVVNGGRNNTRLPQAGFYFDCAALSLQSGPDFTCQRHPAYYKTGEPHPAYLFGGDNIGYDANKSLDDNAFAPAKIYDAKLFGDLYERPVPLLRIEKEQYFTDAKRLKLPYTCAFVPILECDAKGGEVLDLCTDRYTVNGGPGDHQRRYNSQRHEYICKPGHNEFRLPFYLFGEELLVKSPDSVKILRVGFQETGYDCDITGSFECSDILLNKLVEKAARTLYVCMRDNFMDCPDRERGSP